VSEDVAERLTLLRTLNGWSQRELARRAGVTNSAISQIEQGRNSPSVSSLKKVLDSVPITLADFFSMDLAAGDNAFYTASQMPSQNSGSFTAKLVGADKAHRQLNMTWQFWPPAADTGDTLITNTTDMAGVLFDGFLEVTVGARSQTLAAGDSYYIDAGRPYRIRNVSSMGTICAQCLVRQ
jgi:transcriptional regulator with XRE-family HTH domain